MERTHGEEGVEDKYRLMAGGGGGRGEGRPKPTLKKLMEKDCSEWKLIS